MGLLSELSKAWSYVVKPFDMRDWVDAVSSALDSLAAGANTFASAAALNTAVTTNQIAGWVNGTTVWIQTFESQFYWVSTSTAVANGTTVINPTANGTNPGRLMRSLLPSIDSMLQASWFIDQAAGNDENTGAAQTQGAGFIGPLKTHAEWIRRVSGSSGDLHIEIPTMTVNVVGDCSENFSYTWAGNGGTLIHQGVLPAFSNTGSFSAVTNLNAATNTHTQATSTWNPTTELGRLTHDLTTDRWAFVVKDLTGNNARMTPWSSVSLTQGSANGVVSIGNAAINDSWQTFILPKLTGNVSIKSLAGDVAGAGTNLPTLILQQFDINPTLAGGFKLGSVGQNVSLQNCIFSNTPSFFGGRINWANCLLKVGGTLFGNFGSTFVQISAGGSIGPITPAVNAASCITFANQCSFQNTQWIFRGNSRARWVDGSISDTANPIALNQSAGRLDITTTFWGTGNTGVAVVANRATDITFASGAATMTGNTAGVDFSVGGSNTAMPFDPAARTFSAAINCSWANVQNAYGGGTGFGGSLFDPLSGCRVAVNTS